MIPKIIIWLGANGASLIAALQALIKAIKELLTAVLNLLSIFMPNKAWHSSVDAVRGVLKKVDDWLDTIKERLLK
jgi:hypothetical protein